MKVQKLVISNFGSFFGTHAIPMADQGLVFVRGENLDEPKSPSNGAGKSTIFDALDWCLFGEVPRGDTAKSIVNDEVKKDCWVMAQLQEDGALYIVFRFRQLGKEGSGVKFFQRIVGDEHWDNRTALDGDKTQEIINEALGLDRVVFRAAVYRAQGEGFSFAEATDGERKELLTALIPELQEVDDIREVAKAQFQEVQKARSLAQGSIQQAEIELAGLKATDWAGAEAAWKAQQAQKLAQAQQSLQGAQGQLQQAQGLLAQVPTLQQQLAQLQAQPFVPSTAWQAEYDARAAKKGAAETTLTLLRSRYQTLQNELTPFQKGQVAAGPCSRCKQQVTGEHIQQEIARLQALMAPLAAEGAQARNDFQALEAAVKEAIAFRQQEMQQNQAGAAAHAQKVGQLQQQLGQLQQLQKQLPQLEGQVSSWSFHVTALQNEVWPGAAQKQMALDRIAVLEAQVSGSAATIQGYEQKEKLLAFWIEALTAKGLKNLIMDSRIEEMTAAANAWVQAVTAGTTWVRFETQTLTQAGKLSEKLNIRIFRHNPDGSITERNFKSWSGGEKTRVALGTDQGLSKLIADRASKSWDLAIYDESFAQNLDHGGREAVFEQLTEMDRGTVFVVDHSNGTEGHFQKRWTVTCQGRRSHVRDESGWTSYVADSSPEAYLSFLGTP